MAARVGDVVRTPDGTVGKVTCRATGKGKSEVEVLGRWYPTRSVKRVAGAFEILGDLLGSKRGGQR